MKALVALAAAIEIPTGLVLIFDPSVFMRLLFGAEMSGPYEALGPLAGFALLALAIACWPSRVADGPAAPAVRALLAFSALCALYLAYQGAFGDNTGILLWPAAASHALVALSLFWCWLARKALDRGRSSAAVRDLNQ